MVVRQAEHDEAWQLALTLEAGQLRKEAISPFLVGIVEIEAAKVGIKMAFEGLDRGPARVLGSLAVGNPLAVAAIADTGLGAAIPNVAAGRAGDGVDLALRRVARELVERSAPIGQRPDLLDKIGCVGAHR